MSNRAVKASLTVLLLALGAYGGWTFWRVRQALSEGTNVGDAGHEFKLPRHRRTPVRKLEEFTFTATDGKPYSLKQLRGEVWVGSFFFASCPGFCAQLNQTIARLQKEFPDAPVKFISITVDPDNDTPERLRDYAASYHADPARWIFLSGDMDDAEELGMDVFNVTVLGKEHSDRLVLLDGEGKVQGRFRALDGADLKKFKKKLASLLAAQGS